MQCPTSHVSRLTSHVSRLTSHVSRAKVYRKKGFSLAELLVVVGILGLIATFTVPTIIRNIEQAHEKAVAKETVATLHSALYALWQTSQLSTNPNDLANALASNLNVARHCIPPHDCITDHNHAELFKGDKHVLILHNGAWIQVYGVSGHAGLGLLFTLDFNGSAKPNDMFRVNGSGDMIHLFFNHTQQTIIARDDNPIEPGNLRPDKSSAADQVTRYNSWFN